MTGVSQIVVLPAILPLAAAADNDFKFGFICLLYLLGLSLLLLDLIVPGSFLGIIGTCIMIASIVLAFWYHSERPMYGISLLFLTLIILPTMIIFILKRVTLGSSQNFEDGYSSMDESLEDLMGKEGVALTPLRPSGMARIGEKRIDVTSETAMLEKDTPVKVVKVEGNRVVVKATGTPPPAED